MVSIQTKFILAFLVSTFVAVLIWDRGSNKKSQDRDIPQRAEDDERVLHRSRRQIAGSQLNVVYKQFDNLQSCCAVPTIMPAGALEVCQPVKDKSMRRKINGWYNNVRSFYMPGAGAGGGAGGGGGGQVRNQAIKPGVKVRGKRQSAEKIALSSVCYTDCTFGQLGFLNATALELVAIEETFVNKMRSQEWKQVVQDALYTCEEPAACATPSEINMNNRYCSIKPTILMNCMRKQMILNCPSGSRSQDYKCNSGVNALRKTNVMSLG